MQPMILPATPLSGNSPPACSIAQRVALSASRQKEGPVIRIVILFHFRHEPSAITIAHGEITDLLPLLMGDTVSHESSNGARLNGRVVGRYFDYSLSQGHEGPEIEATITVKLSLETLQVQSANASSPSHPDARPCFLQVPKESERLRWLRCGKRRPAAWRSHRRACGCPPKP